MSGPPQPFPVPMQMELPNSYIHNSVMSNREAIERAADNNGLLQNQYGVAGVLATKDTGLQLQNSIQQNGVQG